MRFKKGDRVTWYQDSQQKLGVVLKGGSKRISVVQDGGEYSVIGPATAFNPSDMPLPNADEVNPMAEYSIKAYREIQGHGDSRTFDAKIYKNGKAILHVTNNGWGGPNEYYPVQKDVHRYNTPEMQDFLKAAAAWAKAATGRFGFTEPEDSWVEWEVHERPYGRTAAESLKWYKEFDPPQPK